MANKRESAFCWDKTERDQETYNLAFSNIEMKTAKNKPNMFYCAIKLKTAWFSNKKGKIFFCARYGLKQPDLIAK